MEHFTGSQHTIKYELPHEVGDVPFINRVQHLLNSIEIDDLPFARLCDFVSNLDETKRYIIGFGLGHVWIHRNGQYVHGVKNHPQHQRFAIIVTNKTFYENQPQN